MLSRTEAGVRCHRERERARVVCRGGRGTVLLEAILHALKAHALTVLCVVCLRRLLAVRLARVAALVLHRVAVLVQAVEADQARQQPLTTNIFVDTVACCSTPDLGQQGQHAAQRPSR